MVKLLFFSHKLALITSLNLHINTIINKIYTIDTNNNRKIYIGCRIRKSGRTYALN